MEKLAKLLREGFVLEFWKLEGRGYGCAASWEGGDKLWTAEGTNMEKAALAAVEKYKDGQDDS